MFIGVDGVIVNRRNACGLTPTVSKVSSGALEFIPLYSVKFVSHFFDDAKKDPLNFRIVSTSLDEGDLQEAKLDGDMDAASDGEDDEISFGAMDGEDLGEKNSAKSSGSSLISLDQLRLDKGPKENVILVLGSEGEGVSRTISRCSDHRVVIPP